MVSGGDFGYNIFSNVDMKHILDLITLNEHSGEYYGNIETFAKKTDKLKAKIKKELKK
jgi:hypothetical protein